MNSQNDAIPVTEVTRSFSFKLNLGNYQSADFFCSQKSECAFEDVDSVSAALHAFCKKQVLAAVAEVEANGLEPRQPTQYTPTTEQGKAPSAAASAGSGGQPPAAPVSGAEDNLPAPVKAMWDRMGTRKDLIIQEVQGLRDSLRELMTSDLANEEYAAIVKKFGDPVAKVRFARRTTYELWKRIQAIHAEQIAAAEPQPGDQPMLLPMEEKTEVTYGS